MIEIQDLSKQFASVEAVKEVSFRVEEGQTLALVGTSGSGKTTILKMLNRLVEPTSGQININGISILDQSVTDLRRRMGYVIQDTGLFPHYTIAENIGLVPGLLGWEPDRIHRRTLELMDRLSLPADTYAEQYPHQLSGGQQQRAGIARALAADPPIILMDEPFGALDPITRQDIRSEFKELEELKQKTTILVTHDVEEAFDLGDLVCVLDAGTVQQTGTPHELLTQPTNDFVRRFLADKFTTLQLQVLKLSDLLPHWKATDELEEQYPLFQPTQSLQATMDHLLRTGSSRGVVRTGSRQFVFDINQLLDGLQKQMAS